MTRILGSASARTTEDPFGPGDPVEVARLVRRALAAAGRRAIDVEALVLVAGVAPDPGAMARFARRALGPAGTEVTTIGRADPGGHAQRCAAAVEHAGSLVDRGVTIGVALGPGDEATVRCVGPDRV